MVALLKNEPLVDSRIDALAVGDVGMPLLVLGELLYGAHRSARRAENLAGWPRCKPCFRWSR